MKKQPSIVALIPVRSGSKRVIGKNIKILNDHPLMAYTITAAIKSGIFTDVIVSTNSEEYAAIARHYGADVPFLRKAEFAGDLSPDIEWVENTLSCLKDLGKEYDCFSILRVTSPFRQVETIQRAWKLFLFQKGVDSLRAIERCKQHPGKMWVIRGNRLLPLMPLTPTERPWHSCQYQSLPEVYVQNASLEIAWTKVVFETKTIAGHLVMPFFTNDYEGYDINDQYDWELMNILLEKNLVTLTEINTPPYTIQSHN